PCGGGWGGGGAVRSQWRHLRRIARPPPHPPHKGEGSTPEILARPSTPIERMPMTDLSHAELDKETIAKAYARWAPVYDLVFGAVFERGRHAAVAAAERIGGRILEVGVGTGISLPDYSSSNRLCG